MEKYFLNNKTYIYFRLGKNHSKQVLKTNTNTLFDLQA